MPKFKKCDRVKVLKHRYDWQIGQIGVIARKPYIVPGSHNAPMLEGRISPQASTAERAEYDVDLDIGKTLQRVREDNLELVPTESG